ncbi:hypothetical protein BX666DRAFT_2030012 [Dichotomocladium elegans]|nr:hypothetical protein BX666DRAFT_2030012 [Dichotomocladium elegans]
MVSRSFLCPIQRPISRLSLSLTTTARRDLLKCLFYSTQPSACDSPSRAPPENPGADHHPAAFTPSCDPKRSIPGQLTTTPRSSADMSDFFESVDSPALELNDVWRIVKRVGKNWTKPEIKDALEKCPAHNGRLTIMLFRLLTTKYYQPTKDMHGLIDCIPHSLAPDIQIRLYNMALSAGMKLNRLDHVECVLERMKSQAVDLDVASYTIFIQSLLVKDRRNDARAVYEKMISSGIEPTVATYNTFLGHACRHQLWDDFDMWVERLGNKANTITLRTLMDAVAQHKNQANVVIQLERVFTMVKLTKGSETQLGPAVAALLRHHRSSAALEMIGCIFKNKEPVSVNIYNLYIKALAQEGDLAAAHRVLDRMIDARDKLCSTEKSAHPFTIPPPPDAFSFTALIQGYIDSASSDSVPLETVKQLYQQMLSLGIRRTPILYSILIHGILKNKFVNIQSVRALFDQIVEELEKENPSNQTGIEPMSVPFRRGPGFLTLRHRHYHFSRTSLYNIMMNGYFVHEYYRKERTGASDLILTEQRKLLEEAVQKRVLLDRASLNIWVRGLAVFGQDLEAAENIVAEFKALGVEPNERTIWYLVRTAYRQGRRKTAIKWLKSYEEQQNAQVQGHGLARLKSQLL